MVMKPLVSHVTDIVWSGRPLNADDNKACLRLCKSTHRDFDEWWSSYQSHAFPSDQFLQNMVDALSTLVGDIQPPPPSVNAPDHIIQIDQVGEAPKKVCVTNFIFSFPVDAKN